MEERQAHNVVPSELVDLLFLLVWVPGNHLVSLAGLELKRVGTTALQILNSINIALPLSISPSVVIDVASSNLYFSLVLLPYFTTEMAITF